MSATFNVDCYSDTSSEEGTIYTLLGRDLVVNPHRKNFLGGIPEATIDSSGIKRGGLELDEEWACLYDPWGIFYAVDLDLNSDGKLKNPNYEEVNRGNTELRMRVLVWSGGPDRDKNTWEDNLTSWETPKILQGESGLR
ncbi:MAG TPA: hypothetical protein VG796_25735 [Verrucomicrobiales bacterium]|nr:hypothetical protein [Verrucomicrobiales bacterium]